MALPINARPSSIAGHTEVDLDSGDTLTVPDPDGAILAQGESVAQMRGAGRLGTDQRLAQAPGGMSYGAPGGLIPEGAGGDALPGAAAARQANADAPVGDLVAPGMPGSPRADEVAGRANARAFGEQPAPTGPASTKSSALTMAADRVSAGASQAGANDMPSAVVIPGTKGGMRETSRTTSEVSTNYRKRLEELLTSADQDSDEWLADVQSTINGMTAQHTAKQQERYASQRGKEQAAIIEQSRQEQIKRQATSDVQAAQQLERNPSRLWGNPWFAASAAIGGIASALLDLRNGTNTADGFWSSIWRTLDADLLRQENERSGALEAAKTRLGDAEGNIARLVVQARQAGDVANGLQEAIDAAPVEAAEKILFYKNQALARKQQLEAQAVLAQEGRVSSTQTYQPPTPAKALWIDDAQLAALGMNQESYTKALEAKAGSGENAPTNAQALENIKAVRADAATLDALAKDGVLTGDKIVWNKLSDASRRGLASLGLNIQSEGAVDRDKIRLIVGDRLNEYARSFGGAITDSDRETAKATMGQSVEAQLAFLKRMADKAENSVRGSLNARALGRGQQLIDLQLRAVDRTKGVPQSNLEAY